MTGCSLYVTIEPCPMCAGAAVNAHLSSIIYGAPNPRYGGIDSKFRIVQNPFNHAVSVIHGVYQSECQQLMDEFSMINVIYPCDNCIMERYRSGHNEADSNQLYSNVPWVRIPPAPPQRVSFYESSSFLFYIFTYT